MSKRLLLCVGVCLALLSLPVIQAQTTPVRGWFKLITSYDDDPYAADAVTERLATARFGKDEHGQFILRGDQVRVEDEPVIYRMNPQTGNFEPFATNPWPLPAANEEGHFLFPNEARFPRHDIERDADGKPVLNEEGLQLWKPRDIRRGMNVAFEAAHSAKEATESWAGRALAWGDDNQLAINAHAFIGFNAFYSPSARQLFFGVVPYRPPSEPANAPPIMFETASSWEIAAHEAGHALHVELKPNRDVTYLGFKTWAESFADQVEMWASLRDAERARKLLADTNGDLRRSNALTRIGEVLGHLIGDENDCLRDAFHDKRVSNTSPEAHDRSEVLTGAAYKIFLTIYDELKPEFGAEAALRQAAEIMGFFVTRAADYVPENQMTLTDVAQAYLKVDKEFFGYRYHHRLVEEFTRRELLDADSLCAWQAHEAAVPQLWLHPQWTDERIEQVLQANQNRLGIGPDFGLKLQSVIRIQPSSRLSRPSRMPAPTIVRVQLTRGRGADAQPLDNHGILVFRASGILADYHAPLTPNEAEAAFAPDVFEQTQALTQLNQAARVGLDANGAPLALVRQADGRFTVEARVMRGTGLNTWMEVFTLDNPRGERREILISPIPPNKQIRIADDLLN